MRRVAFAALPACTLGLASLLTGCAMQPTAPGPIAGVALSGIVHGGQQPITGSTIQLYAVSSAGYGALSMPLINPAVVTGAGGSFSITSDYNCPTSSTEVYLTATGGNPGLAGNVNNSAIALVAALGPCGSLNANTHVVINEVTTVAAAYALAPFTSGITAVGTSSTNTAGLTNAFYIAAELVNVSNGFPIASTSDTTMPVAQINSLADMIATCVNSSGSTASGMPCANLYSAATPSGVTAPTDTFTTLLNIARHPTSQVIALYDLVSGTSPFQPNASYQPDWALGILTHTSAGDDAMAGAVDPSSNYWTIGFYPSGAANVSGPTPQHLTNSIFSDSDFAAFGADGTLYLGYYDGGFGILPPGGSGTANLSGGGLTTTATLAGLVVAPTGNIWIPVSNGSLAEFTSTGSPISGPSGFTGLPLYATSFPEWNLQGAFDNSGKLYLPNPNVNTIVQVNTVPSTPTGVIFSGGGLDYPLAVAVDHNGNIWVANGSGTGTNPNGSVSEFSSSGTALSPSTGFNGASLFAPSAIAVDGDGTVWVANNSSGVSSFNSSGVATSPYPIGQAYLLGGHGTTNVALDNAGSVWVAVPFTSSVATANLQLVGAGAPVVTPLVTAAATNKLGVRP